MPGKLQYGQVIRWLSDQLPEDAIIAGGAGNFAAGCTGTSATRDSARSSARPTGPWVTATRRQWRPSWPRQPHGARPVRRRRLPEERPGDRHRRAVRRGVRRTGGEQRHVRHDPHAPGARVPGPRLGDRSAESGFRRLRPRLRRARRDGGADRGLRAGLRARGGFGQAGADRAAHRSGCHHTRDHALGAQGESPSSQGDEVLVVLVARSNFRNS